MHDDPARADLAIFVSEDSNRWVAPKAHGFACYQGTGHMAVGALQLLLSQREDPEAQEPADNAVKLTREARKALNALLG